MCTWVRVAGALRHAFAPSPTDRHIAKQSHHVTQSITLNSMGFTACGMVARALRAAIRLICSLRGTSQVDEGHSSLNRLRRPPGAAWIVRAIRANAGIGRHRQCWRDVGAPCLAIHQQQRIVIAIAGTALPTTGQVCRSRSTRSQHPSVRDKRNAGVNDASSPDAVRHALAPPSHARLACCSNMFSLYYGTTRRPAAVSTTKPRKCVHSIGQSWHLSPAV